MYKIKKSLSNKYISYGIGVVLIYVIIDLLMPLSFTTVYNSLLITIAVYSCTVIVLPRITKYLLVDKSLYILPVLLSTYSIAIIAIVLLRIEYSRPTLLYGFSVVLCWLFFTTLLNRQSAILKLQAIDNFSLSSLSTNQHIEIKTITAPYHLNQINPR